MATAAGRRNGFGQEVRLGQRKGRNGDIGEIVDDEIEPFAAEARQDGLDLEQRASGPSTASTTSATPSQTNITCQSPACAARSARSASTAPLAVRRCTEAAPRRAIMRVDRGRAARRRRWSASLEAALDLAEHGDVAVLLERVEPCCWSSNCSLLVAIKHIEAEIELRQDGVAEQLQPPLRSGCRAVRAARACRAGGRCLAFGAACAIRPAAALASPETQMPARADKQHREQPGDGERPPHRVYLQPYNERRLRSNASRSRYRVNTLFLPLQYSCQSRYRLWRIGNSDSSFPPLRPRTRKKNRRPGAGRRQ